jgi:hypothetical protein
MAARRLRRTALVVGAVALATGSGLLTAGSALASADVEPGNLVFTPANGASTGVTTWHTTDGCPVGYRQSAQVSIFSNGVLLSRISPVVGGNLTGPFSGSLLGSMSEILNFAHVKQGGQLLFMVGCYSLVSGTGNVQWMQSTQITRSTGASYSANAGSVPSRVTGPGVKGTLQTASGSGQVQSVPLTVTNGSSPLEAALIAAACGLAVATGGVVWYRRRQNRSSLV